MKNLVLLLMNGIVKNKFTLEKKEKYLSFLRALIKNRSYIAFVYMTGILPIAKELTQSTLNCFDEYSMLEDEEYYQYFGFTEQEVRNLCEKNKEMLYEDLESWFNGYRCYGGEKIFNPLSVCRALSKNKIRNYWTNTGRFDEIKDIINFGINGVKDEILELIRGEKFTQELYIYGAED